MPVPEGPTCIVSRPITSRSGRISGIWASSPPTMKKISPDSAWGVEPSIGVSRWWIPRAFAARWTSSVAPGLTVEQSQVTRPGRPPARRPDGPRYVSRTTASFGRAVNTTVDAPATSRADAWGTTPATRAARSIAAGATSWTWTR